MEVRWNAVGLCRQEGVTLVELLVTLSVAAILTVIAVPSFREAIRTNRLADLTNDLSTSLAVARSEAIKRGTRVSVCRSENTAASTPACSTASSKGWETGWLIFTDAPAYGTVNGTDAKISVRQGSAYGATITGSTSFARYLSFLPSGMTSASGSITLTVDGKSQHLIIITSGQVHICKEEDVDDC